MKRFLNDVLHGVYLSLYVSPVIFLIETVFILIQNGSFVRYSLDFSLVLARYLLYGFVIGAVCSLVLSRVYPYLRVRYRDLFTLSAIVFSFVFLETLLYLYDLVYPFGSIDNRQRFLIVVVVLSAALLVAIFFFITFRFLFPVFSTRLAEISRARAVKILLLHVLTVLILSGGYFHIQKGLEMRNIRSGRGDRTFKGPDVILIVLDTVRAEALSCYGNELIVTPNLDELAGEGIVFTRATAPSAWTPPSHASLFTGLYPSVHGTSGLNTLLDLDLEVLSKSFSNAGYMTLTLYNNPLAGSMNGMDRDFLFSVGVETDKKVSYFDSRLYSKYVLKDSGVIRTMRLHEAWVEFSRKADMPFFVFVNLNDAHLPFEPREPFFSDYINRYHIKSGIRYTNLSPPGRIQRPGSSITGEVGSKSVKMISGPSRQHISARSPSWICGSERPSTNSEDPGILTTRL